jgi:mannosyl-oligosaccharide alpha-1,2-mannosidase
MANFNQEYMLLGGLEDKYRIMYLDTMDAVRRHMLYRPMIPGDADILFSGRVTTEGDPDNDGLLDPEITHLTCFLGGMVGMGAKLFNVEGDLEIAKKLTDGCVWAYSSMGAGVMAENAKIIPCASVTDCHWNETIWHELLDPSWKYRDQMIKAYDTKKIKQEAQKETDRIAAEAKISAGEEERVATTEPAKEAGNSQGPASDHERKDTDDASDLPPSAKVDVDSPPPESTRGDEKSSDGPASVDSDQSSNATPNLQRRQTEKESSELPVPDANHDQDILDNKKKETAQELETSATGRTAKSPQVEKPLLAEDDPNRPLNHTEFIKKRILNEGLKPGYTSVESRYILR